MRLVFMFLISIHLTQSLLTTSLKRKPIHVYEVDTKKQINEFCIGRKAENFCSLAHLSILNKLIENQERETKMRQMKNNIVEDIMKNVRPSRNDQTNRILKEIMRVIQSKEC
jgi:F0F1-type ATP synthase gamma subunit